MQTEWKANTGKWALLVRSVSTLLLARKISRSVRKLERELEQSKTDDEDAKARWLELHRKNAKLTHRHIIKYRGFLTKVGQAASIKAGDLPAPWVEELRGLQDELPVSPFREVQRTVCADLGKPLEQVFHHFEQRPIASASVAQAHIAWLRSDNRKVCVKVQHRGVANMMSTDLATVEIICSRMAKFHPEAPDATDLIREWRRASREEVDFRLEAKNALQALHALRREKLDVTCPEPVAACCGRRVLTMAYINGWKITDLHRLPFGTDREALVRPLVDAFAMLAFEEGLIHGDPHPGNVFVEPVEAGKTTGGPSSPGKVRAALLDWGIVQRMSEYERTAAARWVVATLAQDRVMYFRALVDLGFVFDVDFDSSEFAGFLEASMGSSAWMFRDSIPSNSQQNFMEKLRQHQENAEEQRQRTAYRQDPGSTRGPGEKLVSKIPGVILFFLRGLEMLQNICGALEVALPFATVLLHRALPLIQSSSKGVLSAMPAPDGCSQLEHAVRARLQELDAEGSILGAQVAVLYGEAGTPGEWLCRVAVGRSGVAGGPICESSLMPLLDASVGVLVMCLLAALARPTVTGRVVGLDTPAVQLWPDFAQRDKGKFTIGQLLRHQAGLLRPFPNDLSLKGFCSEHRIEQILAGLPRERPTDGACRVVGHVAGALLRRALGHRSVAEAVRAVLEPLGLHEHIVYRGTERRMAFVGKNPRKSLPMEKIWEWLEERVDMMESQMADKKPSPWLTWRELSSEKPGYTDPLLVNRDILRSGEGMLPGRGLRASAEALCRLYAADIVPQELLERGRTSARELQVESQEEWWELGRCLQLGEAGWQLFRFQKLDGSGEVVAHGYTDGATGSITLRLPEASIAILLNCADKDTRGVGQDLLSVAVRQFGLKPAWPLEAPPLAGKVSMGPPGPAAKGCLLDGVGSESGGAGGREVPPDVQSTISKMEAKVAKLTEALAAAGVKYEDPDLAEEEEEEDLPPPSLSGTWKSAETEGLQALLEAFEVPAMVRTFAQTARRNLSIKLEGDNVSLTTTTCFMGRQVEETRTEFVVGEAFEGEQELGGAFRGMAAWAEGPESGGEGKPAPPRCHLVLEKQFNVGGREVILMERFLLNPGGRLALTTVLRSGGLQQMEVRSAGELQYICGSLDPESLQLRSEVQLGSELLPRGGRLVGEEGGLPLPELCSLPLPAVLSFQYDDLQSTTMFDRTGGGAAAPRKRPRAAARPAAGEPLGADQSGAVLTLDTLADRILAPAGGAQMPDCAVGLMAAGWAAAALASSALQAVGRTVDAICAVGPVPPAPPALALALPAGATSLEREAGADKESQCPEEYGITIDRCNGTPLGIDLDDCHSGMALLSVSSVSGTLVGQWNVGNPQPQVRVGDHVVEVNGVRGAAEELEQECSKMQVMEIRLRRCQVWRCCWDGGVRIRAVPEVKGDWVGETVAHNEIVLVSQEYRGADGILYLRLADRRGWLFESKPDLGVVCERQEAAASGAGPLKAQEAAAAANDLCSCAGSTVGSSPVKLASEPMASAAARVPLASGAADASVMGSPTAETWASDTPSIVGAPLEVEEVGSVVDAPRLGRPAVGAPSTGGSQASSSPMRLSAAAPAAWVPAADPATPSASSRAAPREAGSAEFSVVLHRHGSAPLGLRADPTDGGTELIVRSIADGGLLAKWNSTCSPGRRVSMGDRIASINGCSGDAKVLVDELCKGARVLDMRLQRCAQGPASFSIPAERRHCPHDSEPVLDPKPSAVVFADPRCGQTRSIGVVGFYCQEREELWDALCGAGFLGSHYDLGRAGLELEAPCERGRRWTFRNSEAAFQALKFWLLAGEFSALSGQAACKKKRRLSGHEDLTYAGFGSQWRGMRAVLRAKFAPDTPWAAALARTGDAFLLEHNPVEGSENIWSDNGRGDGRNWLGMQLMLVRDSLSGKSLWTDYIGGLVDLDTGKALDPAAANRWQSAVRGAAVALVDAVARFARGLPPGGSPDLLPAAGVLAAYAAAAAPAKQANGGALVSCAE